MRQVPFFLGVALAFVAVACSTDRSVKDDHQQNSKVADPKDSKDLKKDEPEPEVPATSFKTRTMYFPASASSGVDLLFVIDNSASMDEEQAMLAQSFPSFIKELERGMIELPDLRVGVISTDLGAGPYTSLPSCEQIGGDRGKLLNTPRVPGCTPPTDPWISHRDGKTNVPAGSADPGARVAEAFGCIARLGIDGCGFEQQLEAARKALDPRQDINNFVRPEAVLAVVFVTDEDDCSAKNPQLFDPSQTALTDPLGPISSFRCFEFGISCDVNDRNHKGPRKNCVPAGDWLFDVQRRYVDFFAALKPPERLVVAALSGPTGRVEVGGNGVNPILSESCQSSAGKATPAIRIEAVVSALGGQISSICDFDYGPAMVDLGKRISRSRLKRCLAVLADTSTAPGLQPSCSVEQVLPSGDVAAIPECSGVAAAASRCWRLRSDPECPDGNALQIEGGASTGSIRASCAVL